MYIKDRLRRSMMFVPGNNPGMIRDAHIYGADSIMFDLEDSVAYTEKDAARLLVYNALRSLNFGSRETVVRINDLSSGLGIEDILTTNSASIFETIIPSSLYEGIFMASFADSPPSTIIAPSTIISKIENSDRLKNGNSTRAAAFVS